MNKANTLTLLSYQWVTNYLSHILGTERGSSFAKVTDITFWSICLLVGFIIETIYEVIRRIIGVRKVMGII